MGCTHQLTYRLFNFILHCYLFVAVQESLWERRAFFLCCGGAAHFSGFNANMLDWWSQTYGAW